MLVGTRFRPDGFTRGGGPTPSWFAEFQVDDRDRRFRQSHRRDPWIIVFVKPSIFVVAHLDTFSEVLVDQHFEVTDKTISGTAGAFGQLAAVGVLASLPDIFDNLGLRFESDIVLVAPFIPWEGNCSEESAGCCEAWPTHQRHHVLESVELGRLNYYSDAR